MLRRDLGHWLKRQWKTENALNRLAIFLLIIGSLWIFAEIAEEVSEGDSLAFDRSLILALRAPGDSMEARGPAWLKQAAGNLTALGSSAVLTLITVVVIGFLTIERKPRTIAFLLLAVVGGMLMTLLLKAGFDRPRPDLLVHAQRVYLASFPSGHSMNSAIVYLLLGVILAQAHRSKAVKVYVVTVAILITVLIGITRVYLGVHWPTDVLAGWTLGAAWALLCWLMLQFMQRDRVIEGESGEPDPADSASAPDRAGPAPGAHEP